MPAKEGRRWEKERTSFPSGIHQPRNHTSTAELPVQSRQWLGLGDWLVVGKCEAVPALHSQGEGGAWPFLGYASHGSGLQEYAP